VVSVVKLKLVIKGELIYDADPRHYGVDTAPEAMAAVDQQAFRDDLGILVDQMQEMSDEQLTITVEPIL
jgi:hypothetical protein